MSNLQRAQRRRLELEAQSQQRAQLELELELQEQLRQLQEQQNLRQPPSPLAPVTPPAELRRPKVAAAPVRRENEEAAADSGAAEAIELAQIAWAEETAALQRAHVDELAQIRAAVRHEAEARASAEAEVEAERARADAAEIACQRIMREAAHAYDTAAAAAAADMEELRHSAETQRAELEAATSELHEALQAAHAESEDATRRAMEAEAAAGDAAAAAMSAQALARREAVGAAARTLSALEERCATAERQLEAQREEAEVAATARCDAVTEPIPELLLAEQAEASRTAVLLHELRVLQVEHERAIRRHATLARRAAVLRRRSTHADSSSDGGDSSEGLEHDTMDADDLQGRRAPHGGADVRERRRVLAAGLLSWYMGTRRTQGRCESWCE
jgi:hypothetical protein